MGTFGSSWCSVTLASTLNLPLFFTHCEPMIGPLATVPGIGPLAKFTLPTGVLTTSVLNALATAALLFGLWLALSAASPTSKTEAVEPTCCSHCRPVAFVYASAICWFDMWRVAERYGQVGPQ